MLVLIGVLIFSGGVGVTFWNEGRTVKRSKALEEGLTMVTTLKSSPRDGRIPGEVGGERQVILLLCRWKAKSGANKNVLDSNI